MLFAGIPNIMAQAKEVKLSLKMLNVFPHSRSQQYKISNQTGSSDYEQQTILNLSTSRFAKGSVMHIMVVNFIMICKS